MTFLRRARSGLHLAGVTATVASFAVAAAVASFACGGSTDDPVVTPTAPGPGEPPSAPPPSGPADPGVPPSATLRVSFKLDPGLSGPTYGGERWVSPQTYTGASSQDTVEARVDAFDAQGSPVKTDFEWSSSDPQIVTVDPSRGEQVAITANLPGVSVVTVKSSAASTELSVTAVQTDGIWQVTISQ